VIIEVAMVGRDAIGAVKNCEEIRQQINQHQRPGCKLWRERGALGMRENTHERNSEQEWCILNLREKNL
jgi:hypothetical protein